MVGSDVNGQRSKNYKIKTGIASFIALEFPF